MKLAAKMLGLGFALLLCSCVAPQKVRQTEQDRARYDQQQNERAAYDRCNQDALPGTVQHLACRVSSEKQK